MAQPCSIRQRRLAAEQYQRYKFNDSPTTKQMKWIRYLWLMGVRWKDIRQIYNIRDTKLLEVIKMPHDWEAKAA